MSQEEQDILLIERIESYLLGEMEEREQRSFEQEIADSPSLSSLVDAHRKAMKAVLYQGFKETMDSVMDYEQDNHDRGPLKRYALVSLAASVLILIAFSLWQNSSSEYEELYQAYYRPDPGIPVTMGLDDSNVFIDGMVDYKMGSYTLAQEKWGSLVDQGMVNDTLSYYLASAHMALEQFADAESEFSAMTLDKNHVFYEDAKWYLALCYLRNEKLDAFHALEIKPNSIYYSDWKRMNEELSK